ncbi:MAG: hypothetical protein GX425_02915, partial [Peptococcaceae bacterium]|nr:hypothetical protein [Peptococcaceae bacterium]
GEKASGAAKTKVTSFGQEVSLLARTVNEATGADIPIPLFAQPDREPGAAPGQVYDMIQAALETTEAENTTFTKLAKPVVAELGYPALFEAAAAAEDAPAFDASIPAVTTVRAGTADVPDQVLKTVSADSQSATGQVVNSQELAAAPTGATSNSGAAVKSAEEEKAVSTGKTETSPAGTAVDTEAAKTGGKGAGGVVENTAPNNAPQYNPVSPMSSSSDNLKTVKLADMRDALVQEIERAYRQQKSDTWTQVDLKLEPEHLGKLTIKLFFNGGELNAHFYAGNDYVKDVLESSIQQLRQTLDQQDLKLNQAFVFVGDDGRSGTGQSESGGRQPAHYPRSYGGLTYGEIVAEAAAYEPGGNSYKIVNYLI